ncbi:MAG: hypothetical protein AAGJ18_01195 [Bacteroidota bacterium]
MCPKTATSISNPAKDKTRFIPLQKGAYQLGIANSIGEIAHFWELAAPSHDEFLQIPYLSFLESRPPGDLHFKYLVFCIKNTPIGVAYCQISELKIREALTDSTLSPFRQKLNDTILKVADMNALFCGNILLTGEHGSYFRPDISTKTQNLLLKEGLEVAKQECKKAGDHLSLVLVKDLDATRKNTIHGDLGKEYKEFSIQPKMILQLRPDWNNFEDYLAAMTSKYRVRAKRAFKKGGGIEKRELSLDSIKAFLPKIDELYKAIAEGAGFNVVTLDGEYFLNFKKHFPEKFRLFGYFLEGEMIAFYTTFHNYEELEAHFLGFADTTNRAYQVYLNILYDLIKLGIEQKASYINFARTALEIKSSVGAEPVDLFYLGKHTNLLKNTLFTPILAYFNPTVDWVQRKPFRE